MAHMTISRNKPYFNIALLLIAAAGCDDRCFRIFYSYDKKWQDFACWIWSGDFVKGSREKKKAIIKKVNEAQGIDLEDWYWANQTI